jgi:hypothetical protein
MTISSALIKLASYLPQRHEEGETGKNGQV